MYIIGHRPFSNIRFEFDSSVENRIQNEQNRIQPCSRRISDRTKIRIFSKMAGKKILKHENSNSGSIRNSLNRTDTNKPELFRTRPNIFQIINFDIRLEFDQIRFDDDRKKK
jgi:hypothetical protein